MLSPEILNPKPWKPVFPPIPHMARVSPAPPGQTCKAPQPQRPDTRWTTSGESAPTSALGPDVGFRVRVQGVQTSQKTSLAMSGIDPFV